MVSSASTLRHFAPLAAAGRGVAVSQKSLWRCAAPFLACVALMLGAGCGSEDAEPPTAESSATPPGTRVQCEVPEDCGANLGPCRIHVCDEGQCTVGRDEVGASCSAHGGAICDAEGRCVACLEDSDCGEEEACSARANCVPLSCANGVLDPGESDVDCGGPLCEPCTLGALCTQPADCESGYCAEAVNGSSAESEEASGAADGTSGGEAGEASDAGTGDASADESEAPLAGLRCSSCTEDDQCAAGEICDPRTSTCERDLCEPNPCTRPPGPACDGDEVVVREDAGECTSTLVTIVCAYPIAERENCAAQGRVCSGGACVDPATAPATLQVDGAPLAMQTGGSATLRVVHAGGSEAARTVRLDVAGTALAGRITVDASACGRLEPGAQCTLSLTAGPSAVPPTRVIVAGENTNEVEVVVEIIPGQPGDAGGGGVVVRLPSNGAPGLVAARSDVGRLEWGGAGISAGASSVENGRANSQLILSRLEPGFAPAAEACAALEVGASGQGSCTAGEACFDDWYLPARVELLDVYAQRAAIGNFSQDFYWSSTETFAAPANLAEAVNFQSGVVFDEPKAADYRVRCVRALR